MAQQHPMTIAEQIIARHAGRAAVTPGEILEVEVDLVTASDLSGIMAIRELEKAGIDEVFDPQKVCLIPDHLVPNRDILSANNARGVKLFAEHHGTRYYEMGRGGIQHVLVPDEGLCAPGELIAGGDSHTCTYGALNCFAVGIGHTDVAAVMATGELWLRVPESIRVTLEGTLGPWVSGKDVVLSLIGRIGISGANYQVLEYGGPGLKNLTVVDRLTISNMAAESGAKTAIFAADAATEAFVRARTARPFTTVVPEPGARYAREIALDMTPIRPQVAKPFMPSNVVDVREVAGTPVDQVTIGSCTNGRIEDLRVVHQILRGKQTDPRIKVIVFPGSQRVYLEAAKEGIVTDLIAAGCMMNPPTCGPCFGGNNGILGDGEVSLSTTNRNFVGRMGAKSAQVYLANPAVAAATALTGVITDPADVAAPASAGRAS